MSRDMVRMAGWAAGAVVGLILGVVVGIAGFYLLYMMPRGIAFPYTDQGTLIVVLTGPIGLLIGAAIGVRLVKHMMP